MTIYYDDIILMGTRYKPQWYGQHASPGWADDIVYFAAVPFSGPAPGTQPPWSGFIYNMGRMMTRRG